MTRRSSRSSGLCYSLGPRNRWQQVITGNLLLLPSNGHGREALVPRVYSAFKMAALCGWSIVLKFDKRSGIKRLKSQAIFKSIEKLSDSRILDIYLRVLKKEEQKPPPACLWWRWKVILCGNQCYFNPKRKTEKRKGSRKGSGFETKKKKKRKRRKKKPPCRIRTPALSPEDLSFSTPHTIRPPAHGRVTSFPAYTNLTDK